VKLVPSKLSFANPLLFKTAVYTAIVKNFGTVRDGPALLSLQVSNMNGSCRGAFVLPFSPQSITLKPGQQTQRQWLVLFFPCGDPSPNVDYVVTAGVSASGDSKPGNDALSATVDILKRQWRGWPW
jgi:hypothetical protein